MSDTTIVYAEIGNRLRYVRKIRTLTQADLAQAVGMTRASITNIELGRQRVPIDRLYAMASVLLVDIDVLFPSILTFEPFEVSGL